MLRADDRIRLYIQTEQSCDVYVVHSDQHVASLWLANMRTVPKEPLVLPSMQAYYQLSGARPQQSLTVICAQAPLPALAAMATQPLDEVQWQRLYATLEQQRGVVVAQHVPAQIAIGGNVRGINTPLSQEQVAASVFLHSVPISSGNGLLMSRYAFQIQP